MSRTLYIAVIVALGLTLVAGCSRRFKLDRTESISAQPDWPFSRGDQNALAAKSEGKFSGKLDIVWEVGSNDKPAGPLTIYFNRLIYPGTRNRIKLYACEDGRYQGYIKPGGTPQAGMVIEDSLGYFAVGPDQSELKCINLFDRKQMWDKPVKDAAGGSIIVKNLLIVGSGTSVTAHNRFTGEKVWSVTVDGRVSAPASSANGIVYQPTDDGTLYALDAQAGKELFRAGLDGPLEGAVAIGDLIYATALKGGVFGLEPTTGEMRWRTDLDGPIWTSPTVADGRLYIGSSNGTLSALDAKDGTIVWKYDAVDVIRASAIAVDNSVIFGTMSGKLFSLNRTDGSLLQSRQLKGAIAQAPVSDGVNVYVATDKGYIVCFGEKHEPDTQSDQGVNTLSEP